MTTHLLPTYARVDLAFERGEGAWLVSTANERYLDFSGGVAVNVLGHAHPHLLAALNEQAQLPLFKLKHGRSGGQAHKKRQPRLPLSFYCR